MFFIFILTVKGENQICSPIFLFSLFLEYKTIFKNINKKGPKLLIFTKSILFNSNLMMIFQLELGWSALVC